MQKIIPSTFCVLTPILFICGCAASPDQTGPPAVEPLGPARAVEPDATPEAVATPPPVTEEQEEQAEAAHEAGMELAQQANYAAALPFFSRAAALDPSEDQYPYLAAATCMQLGRFAEAADFLQRAVRAAAAQGGFDRVAQYHQHILLARNSVVPEWVAQKRQAAAQVGPEAATDLQAWQSAVAHIHQLTQLGHLDSAVNAAQELLAKSRGAFGDRHPNTLYALNTLATLQMQRGKNAGALVLLEEAAAGSAETFGPSHPDTLAYRNNVATLLQGMGRSTDALEITADLVRLARETLGPGHAATSTYQMNLGGAYMARNELAKAEPLLAEALRTKTELLGTSHPERLGVLRSLAELFQARDDMPRALGFFSELLAASTVAFGPRHENTTRVRDGLITWYRSRGDVAAADALRLETLSVVERIWGPRSEQAGEAVNALGQYFLEFGDYAQARDRFTQALDILRKAHDEHHLLALRVTNNLALALHRLGDFDQGAALLEPVLARARATLGDKSEDVAGFQNTLALLRGGQGRWKEARVLYEQTMALRRRIHPEDHPELLRALFNLGMHAFKEGRYDEAEPLLKEAAQRRAALFGEKHPATLSALNGLGLLYQWAGNYSQARPALERAWAGRRDVLGANHRDTLISRHNLVVLFQKQGLYEKAEPLLVESLAARKKHLGSTHPDTLASVTDLALFYSETGQRDKSLPLLEEALALSRSELGPTHPATIRALSNLAETVDVLGQTDRAIALGEQAANLGRQTLGQEHPDVAIYVSNLGLYHYHRGEFDKARRQYEMGAELKRRAFGASHPETLIGLSNLALFYQARGLTSEALVAWRDSAQQTHVMFDQVLWGADEETRHAYVAQTESVDGAMISFWLAAQSPQANRDLFAYALERKGILLRVGAQVAATARATRDPRLSALTEELATKRRELSRRTLAGPGGQQVAPFFARTAQLVRRIQTLEAELGRSVEQLRRARATIAPKQVVAALKPGEVLVDFLIYRASNLKTYDDLGEQLLAIIVKGGASGGITALPLGAVNAIAPQVTALREALQALAAENLDRLRLPAHALYAQLWAPLGAALGNARTVYLVPDGLLHLVPFAALLDEAGHYLVQQRQLVFLSSSRDLVLPAKGSAHQNATLFAAPSYDHGGGQSAGAVRAGSALLAGYHFGPLPGTAKEVKRIARLLKKRGRPHRVVTGPGASEAAVLAVQQPALLHLATHGFFLSGRGGAGRTPQTRGLVLGSARPKILAREVGSRWGTGNPLLRSGLALSGANLGARGKSRADGTDGILTAVEVLAMDLTGTELVVLSACETGVGETRAGEGVYGLRRAFQEAGAAAVLSTLWPVDDAATQAFMERFYGAWLGSMPAAAALRATQRDIAKEERWRHPFFWAGFVVVGR